jgi:hypothetical protein
MVDIPKQGELADGQKPWDPSLSQDLSPTPL